MFVFIPGSIPPVRFGPAGTDPAEISIPAVTYIRYRKVQQGILEKRNFIAWLDERIFINYAYYCSKFF